MVRAHKNNLIRRSRGDAVFDVVNFVLITLITLLIIYPIYYTIIVSFSDVDAVATGKVIYKPVGFSLEAYTYALRQPRIASGYLNSFIYTAGSILWGLFITLPLAYAMSKKYLFGKSFFSWFFIITMYVSGGMIPCYLLRRDLGLLDNRLVLILGAVSTYNMVIARTYFQNSIPNELYESARCDGAGEFRCFFTIALPLAAPITAVLALYFGVAQWNSYFNAMIYLSSAEKFPLQLVLHQLLNASMQALTNPESGSLTSGEALDLMRQAKIAETMKYSMIFIGSAPLLVAYPFVQKFFIKGMMIGALKG